MGYRTFSFGLNSGNPVVYDPCTGLIHLVPSGNDLAGRNTLDDQLVNSWSIIEPVTQKGDFPILICWSPIIYCNLHCPYCLDDKTLTEGNQELRVHVSKLIADSKIIGVDLSGGEPLLIPKLENLVRNLRAGEIAVSITTNGWFLTERIGEIADSIDAIRISLDGAEAATHDRWRGYNSFNRALKGLRTAVNMGIPVQIQTVAMKSNIAELGNLFLLAANEGVTGVTVLQMLPFGEGENMALDEMLDDNELKIIVDNLRIPPSLVIRMRLRKNAGGFTVVRADGSVYRNNKSALLIGRICHLQNVDDLRN